MAQSMPNPVTVVDIELRQQSAEYSAMLFAEYPTTSHREAYHTAAPGAPSNALLGSPDRKFSKEVTSRFIFPNELTTSPMWLFQQNIWPVSRQTSYDIVTEGKKKKKKSKTALYINPLWLMPVRTKEYVLCSAWWLIHFSRLLSSVLSLRVCISLPLSVSLSTFPGKYFMPEQSASAYLHPYPIALLMASGPQALNFSGDGPHRGLPRLTPMHLGTHVSMAGRSKRLRAETMTRETSHKFQLPPKPWISCWYSCMLFILLEMYTTVRTKRQMTDVYALKAITHRPDRLLLLSLCTYAVWLLTFAVQQWRSGAVRAHLICFLSHSHSINPPATPLSSMAKKKKKMPVEGRGAASNSLMA